MLRMLYEASIQTNTYYMRDAEGSEEERNNTALVKYRYPGTHGGD